MNDQIVVVEPKTATNSQMAQLALEVGEANGYTYFILRHTGDISEQVVKLGWYYHPREIEKGEIPKIADRMKMPVYNAGIPVAREIIGHEIKVVDPNGESSENAQVLSKNRLVAIGAGVLAVTALATVFVSSLVAPPVAVAATPVVAAPSTTALAALGLGVVLLDPALILVLSDGPNGEPHTWLQVASWLDF